MSNEGGMCPKCDLPFTNLAEHLTTHRGQAMTPPRDQQSERIEQIARDAMEQLPSLAMGDDEESLKVIGAAIKAALTAHDEAREHLGNLLAEHGNEKATTDAIAKYYELRARHDEALPGEWTVEKDLDAYMLRAVGEWLPMMHGVNRDILQCVAAAHNSAMRGLVDALREVESHECTDDKRDYVCWIGEGTMARVKKALQPYSGQTDGNP